MLQQFKNRNYNRSLQEVLDAPKRKRRAFPFEKARRIGLIFDATKPETGKELMTLVGKMESQGKEIKPLGFLNKKEIEIAFPYSVFGLKDCNWSGVPNSESCEAFYEKNFELLIVINPEMNRQVHWMACRSEASMKLSTVCDLPHDFDVQLDVPEGKDFGFFFDQLALYLDKIELGSKHESTSTV